MAAHVYLGIMWGHVGLSEQLPKKWRVKLESRTVIEVPLKGL